MQVDTPPGGPYGERLLPQIIDAYAIRDPERLYALVPYSTDLSQAFRRITMRGLSNAVNHVAWRIHKEIGHSDTFETLAYMGAADIRYGIIFFAAIKCGYKLLVPSARNSLSGNISLLAACKCTKVFCTTETVKRLPDLAKNMPDLQHFVLESLEHILAGYSEHYPYDREHADGVKDPVLVCHTSGSTGAPKPIILPNGAFSVIDNQRKLSKIEGRRNMDYSLFDLDGAPFVNTFPGFHVGGMVSMAALPIYYNTTVVMMPTNRPANGEMLSEIMSQLPIAGMFTPPTVIEELLETRNGYNQLAQTKFIMYGGGPLAPLAGNRISEVTTLTSGIGSTECGIIPSLLPSKEDWEYFEWHPDYEVRMVHVEDDIYELTIPNVPRLGWIHTVFHTFPEVDVWRTNDRYKQHPTKLSLFTFRGRGDDVIVLSNGEKFQPVTTESIIQGHPDIDGALVVGTGRFQPALIIEPRVYGAGPDTFINSIWPVIQQANQEAAAHGKLFKGKVILTSPDKPFVRAAKGTIIRSQSTTLYANEIEALFRDSVGDDGLGSWTSEQVKDSDSLRASLVIYVRSILPGLLPGDDGNKEDLFAYGLDSVQAVELAGGLRCLLQPHLKPTNLANIGAKMIYTHATVDSLSGYINGLLGTGAETANATNRSARMSAMVDKYTKGLLQATNTVPKTSGVSRTNGTTLANGFSHTNNGSNGRAICVVLTGSTGSLGTQLLQALLHDRQVSRVICLNRAENALERTQKRFAQMNLIADLSKAEFYTADLGDGQLGLPTEVFGLLQDEADIIIHNAWNVNFNQPLESFEDQIRGVRNFIDLSATSVHRARVMFVSSVASVANWQGPYPHERYIPEATLTNTDYNVAAPMGYGESKHVAERILGIAASQCGVKVDILRLGQVAGPISPDSGPWNKNEWFPSLVQTSKSLGYIPATFTDVDWIPVDVLARIIRDIAHQDHEYVRIYNLINPRNVAWKSMVPIIQKSILAEIVPLKDWIERLKGIAVGNTAEVMSKPAVKILDWFSDVESGISSGHLQIKYSIGNGIVASKVMEELGPVTEGWVRHWIEQLDL